MTHKTQPTAHAEITAPISADLRRIDGGALRSEYRATMPVDVLHLWAKDAIACIQELEVQAAAKCLHRADAAHDPAIEKPEAGRYVLAWTEGAKAPIRAMWVPQFFLEMTDDDAESGEYCEAKDQYFCPKGWYENNAHEETHWNVDRPVIAWMELPRLDAAQQAAPPAPAAVAVPELRLSDEQIEQAFISARDEFMLREVERTDKKLRLAFGRAVLHSARAALAAAPAQAWPSECDSPELCQVHRGCAGQYGTKNTCPSFAVLNPCNSAAPAQEHATQLAGRGQEPAPPVAVTVPVEWPATCDGLEQEAWEAWARVQRFDMVEHPMHYLFLNERTDAARQGWKGGLVYAVEQMKQRVHVVEAAPAQAQEDAPDPVRALIATHAEMLEDNAYAYFELAYTRQTGWMAWITDKPLYGAPVVNPDRKVLANGQGDTPDEACADAARAAQGGA